LNLKTEPGRTTITRFICQELLYEYVSGRLTPERRREVEAYLATCHESQRELERLNLGLEFTVRASKVAVSETMHSDLLNFEPHWRKAWTAATMSFSRRGWRWMPYGFGVAILSLGLLVFKPWHMTMRSDVLLFEQVHDEPDMNAHVTPLVTDSVTANSTTPPKVAVNEDEQQNAEVREATAPIPPALLADRTASSSKSPLLVPSVQPLASSNPSQPSTAAKMRESAHESEESVGGKGWLVREDLDVTDFDIAWPAIRDKIVALNGKVAGNVELGWLRQEGESYFHFSLPESNRAELELFLKTFGPVRISKERHPRVMPEGQIRIILTVKDGNKNEGPAEAP